MFPTIIQGIILFVLLQPSFCLEYCEPCDELHNVDSLQGETTTKELCMRNSFNSSLSLCVVDQQRSSPLLAPKYICSCQTIEYSIPECPFLKMNDDLINIGTSQLDTCTLELASLMPDRELYFSIVCEALYDYELFLIHSGNPISISQVCMDEQGGHFKLRRDGSPLRLIYYSRSNANLSQNKNRSIMIYFDKEPFWKEPLTIFILISSVLAFAFISFKYYRFATEEITIKPIIPSNPYSLINLKSKPRKKIKLTKSEIRNLNRLGYSCQIGKRDVKIDEELCCICLENITSRKYRIFLCGKHYTHTDCFTQWLAYEKKNSKNSLCPMRCSTILLKGDTRQNKENKNLPKSILKKRMKKKLAYIKIVCEK